MENYSSLCFPAGSNAAVVDRDVTYSYDDLHSCVAAIQAQLVDVCGPNARRIMGCLRDDPTALFALLSVTEIVDYVPINPRLTDAEIRQMAIESGCDGAIVSTVFLPRLRLALADTPIQIVCWDDIVTSARSGEPQARPKVAAPGRLILHTSGSTSTPKRVPITLASINASATNIAKAHGLDADDHALNILPLFHIGGLVDVMLAPFAAGGRISVCDDRSPHGIVAAIERYRPTWIQLVPTILHHMVNDLPHDVLAQVGRSLRFVRCISAPLHKDLRMAAEAALGCPIVEMYGMTETAGQIVTQARDLATRRIDRIGKPAGVDVMILDSVGNPVPQGEIGEICVSGPTVFSGYEGISRDEVFFDNWFRTGDLGHMDDLGYLSIAGRLKEMINIGGEKVSPLEIEDAALDFVDVQEAAAYALGHPTLGEQVGLTLAVSQSFDQAAFDRHMQTQLAHFKIPRHIRTIDRLPRLANAKVDRVLLKRLEQVDQKQSAVNSSQRYSSTLQRQIADLWAQHLKTRHPLGADDFFDMGGDSLSSAEFLMALETVIKREVSPNQLFETPRFDDLCAALSVEKRSVPAPTSQALRHVKMSMSASPGAVAIPDGVFRGFGTLRNADPIFWSVQDTQEGAVIVDTFGKERPLYVTGSLNKFTERTPQDFDDIARQFAAEINEIQPEGAITLGGYCGGAWVMQRVAETLIRMGRDIRVLIALDYWADAICHFPVLYVWTNRCPEPPNSFFPVTSVLMRKFHPCGVRSVKIDCGHQEIFENLSGHREAIAQSLTQLLSERPTSIGSQSDPVVDRVTLQNTAKATLALESMGKFYTARATVSVPFRLQNLSDFLFEPTEKSGLVLTAHLRNLDMHPRTKYAGYWKITQPIAPGAVTEGTIRVTFPTVRLPLWLEVVFYPLGGPQYAKSLICVERRLLFPNLISRTGPGITASR